MTTGNLIFCCDANYGIGKNNALPWEYPLDMKWFKAVTDGYPCVGGKNTWDSIGSSLKGRESHIISTISTQRDGFEIWKSVDEFLEYIYGAHFYAIGGPSLWDELLDKAEIGRIYQTMLKGEYECDVHISQFMKNKIQWDFTKKFEYENEDAIFAIFEKTDEVFDLEDGDKYMQLYTDLRLETEESSVGEHGGHDDAEHMGFWK